MKTLPALFGLIFLFPALLFPQNATVDSLREVILSHQKWEVEGLQAIFSLTSQFTAINADSARKYAELGVSVAAELGDSSELFLAHRKLGRIKGSMQMDMEGMLEEGKKAMALAIAMDDSVKMATAGMEIGMTWPAISLPEAIQYTEDAVQVLEELVQKRESEKRYKNLTDACGSLGFLYMQKDLEQSIQWRKKAAHYAQKAGSRFRFGIQMAALGTSYRNTQNDSAIYFFQQARQVFSSEQKLHQLGVIFTEIGTYYSDLGYADSVLKYTKLSISLGEQTNNPEAIRQGNKLLATFYQGQKMYEEALRYAQKQLAIERASPSGHLPSILNLVGNIYVGMGNKEDATLHYQEAVSTAEALNTPASQALALKQLGDMAFEEMNYQLALDLYQEAKDLGEPALADRYISAIAITNYRLKRFEVARKNYLALLELSQASTASFYRKKALRGLASCDSSLGNFVKAYQHLWAFYQLDDTLSERQYNEQVAQAETALRTAQKEATIKEMAQAEEIQALQLSKTTNQRNLLLALASILAIAAFAISFLFVQLSYSKKQIQRQADELTALNATKDRLFGIVAHDLRGPVTGFQTLGKLFTHHLQRGNTDKLKALSERVEQQGLQLKTLLDNLLQWSLQQLGTYRPQWEQVLLEPLGREVIALHAESSAAKDTQIELEIPEDLHVKADKNGLHVVLNNLLSNAIKFTEKGKIWLKAQRKADQLYIEVRDTGSGMTEAQLKEFREKGSLPSQKGSAGEAGTGLGLNLVAQLIRHWGGKLEIQSDVQKGTYVQIYLPAK